MFYYWDKQLAKMNQRKATSFSAWCEPGSEGLEPILGTTEENSGHGEGVGVSVLHHAKTLRRQNSVRMLCSWWHWNVRKQMSVAWMLTRRRNSKMVDSGLVFRPQVCGQRFPGSCHGAADREFNWFRL